MRFKLSCSLVVGFVWDCQAEQSNMLHKLLFNEVKVVNSRTLRAEQDWEENPAGAPVEEGGGGVDVVDVWRRWMQTEEFRCKLAVLFCIVSSWLILMILFARCHEKVRYRAHLLLQFLSFWLLFLWKMTRWNQVIPVESYVYCMQLGQTACCDIMTFDPLGNTCVTVNILHLTCCVSGHMRLHFPAC